MKIVSFHIFMMNDVCICHSDNNSWARIRAKVNNINMISMQTNRCVTYTTPQLHQTFQLGQSCKTHKEKPDLNGPYDPNTRIDGPEIPIEYYIACVSTCTVGNASTTTMTEALILWDNGSSLSFVLTSLCKDLGLSQIGTWRGTLTTITSDKHVIYPVYSVPIKAADGKLYEAPCLAVDFIGEKSFVPREVYQDICNIAGVSIRDMDTEYGLISLLLGCGEVRMFPHMIDCPKQFELQRTQPNIRIMQCQVTDKIFAFGVYMRWQPLRMNHSSSLQGCSKPEETHVSRGQHRVCECGRSQLIDGQSFGLFSKELQQEIRSSFRKKNKFGLKLSIPKPNLDHEDTSYSRFSCASLEAVKNSPDDIFMSDTDSDTTITPLPSLESVNLDLGRRHLIPPKQFEDNPRSPTFSQIKSKINEHYAKVHKSQERQNHYDVPQSKYKSVFNFPKPKNECSSFMQSLTSQSDDQQWSELRKNYDIDGFSVNIRQCTVVLKCKYESCKIHHQIKEHKSIIIPPHTGTESHTSHLSLRINHNSSPKYEVMNPVFMTGSQ